MRTFESAFKNLDRISSLAAVAVIAAAPNNNGIGRPPPLSLNLPASGSRAETDDSNFSYCPPLFRLLDTRLIDKVESCLLRPILHADLMKVTAIKMQIRA